jgi:hypothetical protein
MPQTPEPAIVNPWVAGLVGFILGALAASAWFVEGSLSSAAKAPEPADTAATTSVATPSSGIVSVADQPAGDAVLVDSVAVENAPIWVAVEEIKDRQLGNVLGAAYADGPSTNVSVPLLRATAPGTTYAIVLYRDNGDRSFDLASDSVYVDLGTGERVVALFKTLL